MSRIFPTPKTNQFTRYFLLGCLAVTAQYTCLVAGVEWFHLNKTFAALLAFLIAVSLNYVLQRKFAFQSKISHTKAVSRFFLIACLAGLLNMVVFQILSVSFHYLLAQAVASLIVFFLNYKLNQRYTF
jgi:putative flippase GtrA